MAETVEKGREQLIGTDGVMLMNTGTDRDGEHAVSRATRHGDERRCRL